MPSFYSRSTGRTQLPLTPPEYGPSHYAGTQAMPYHQALSTQPGTGHGSSNGYYDPFLQEWTYPRDEPSHFFPPNGSVTVGNFGKLAPILPPLVSTRPPTFDPPMANDLAFQPRHDSCHTDGQHAQSKAEKPVGGVSATLDYDMETMTDFVAEMAHGMYALFNTNICVADIDMMRSIQPGMNYQTPDAPFRKWVHQVLCATRLPSATILLSLQFLTMRMQQLSRGDQRSRPHYQRQRMLTVAFILGSKFLDDNTFINRSWSEVSGVEVKVLNFMELDWFQAMDHRLHREPAEHQGFNSWHDHWKNFEHAADQRKVKLSPIDTSVQFQKAVLSSYSAPVFNNQPKQTLYTRPQAAAEPMRQYDTPPYSQYDHAWLYPRSASDGSPASAPHTGPTTPEYYSAAGPLPTPWSGNGGYSRRTMFGFPAVQSSVPQTQTQAAMSATLTAPNQEPSLRYVQSYNGHRGDCRCFQCCYSSPRNYMQGYSAFAQPLSVAG